MTPRESIDAICSFCPRCENTGVDPICAGCGNVLSDEDGHWPTQKGKRECSDCFLATAHGPTGPVRAASGAAVALPFTRKGA
jgi:hypothetical protein